jgi:hypothetical protein
MYTYAEKVSEFAMRLLCAPKFSSIAVAVLLLLLLHSLGMRAQIATDPPPPIPQQPPEASYMGAADPRAVIIDGNTRFTILPPQLIRMEWAADGRFEDRPSFVFLNRRMPVSSFTAKHHGRTLTIETSALLLQYTPQADGRFTPTNLSISLTDFHPSTRPNITWHPGQADTDDLQGTTRTLDGARGDKIGEPIEPGLLSREGWSLLDDSARPLFDSDDFTFAN